MELLTGQNNRELLPELIKDKIISDINSGRLHPGERLPGDRALAKENGWGRGSVIEALRILEQDKYIERLPGRGTFVSADVHKTMSSIRLILPFPEPFLSREIQQAENFYVCMTVFQGMVSYAGKSNTQVLFQHFKEPDNELELQRQFEFVKEFDGAVFLGHELTELRLKLLSDNFPVAYRPPSLSGPSELEHRIFCSSDSGIEKMAAYLKKHDYRRIAIVTGEKNLDYSDIELNKIKILRKNLFGYADIPDEHIFNIPTAIKYKDLTSSALEKVITRKLCEDFEIMICFNSNSILPIYRRLFELRLIPGQDIDLMAKCSAGIVENLVPSMTHIEVPNFAIGELLCQSVVNEIQNKTREKEFICMEPELLIGDSSRK